MDLLDVALLVVAFVVILVGADLFTNGVEWFGHRLHLAEGAVGSVLAAVGTALPETMIPIVAILFPSAGSTAAVAEGVGVGAILGAPFMLATLAMFVTGVAVLIQARKRSTGDRMLINAAVVGMDIRYFLVAYAVALGAALLPPGADIARVGVAVVLLGIYAYYVRAHFIADPDIDAADLAPLRFRHLDLTVPRRERTTPRLRVINLQVVMALAFIVGGAVVFVDAVEHLSGSIGIPAAVLALVIAPIATELPEKFNSVIWVRQAKDTLAMGNISGAMVFQSCIPTVVGLIFAADTWTIANASHETLLAFASAAIAFASVAAIFLPMIRNRQLTGRGLLVGGGFYVAYIVLVLASIATRWI
jgi:cation:H+ antiporter